MQNSSLSLHTLYFINLSVPAVIIANIFYSWAYKAFAHGFPLAVSQHILNTDQIKVMHPILSKDYI